LAAPVCFRHRLESAQSMDCVANFPWCESKGGEGEERKKKTNERETQRERASKREKEWTRETLRVAP